MDQKIRDKLEALLRHAKEGNEAEAEVAMRAARKLMAEHGISSLDQQLFKSETLDCGQKWVQLCIHAACKLYGVVPVFQDMSFGTVKFCGAPDLVHAALVTADYLIGRVEAEYKRALPHRMTQSDRAKYRRDFKLACSTLIYHRAYDIASVVPMSSKGKGELVVFTKIKQEEQRVLDAIKNEVTINKEALKLKTESLGALDGILASERIDLNQKVE